jgi:hypothetical protein
MLPGGQAGTLTLAVDRTAFSFFAGIPAHLFAPGRQNPGARIISKYILLILII